MLLIIDHYVSFTEQGMFPAEPEVTAWTADADGARVGERR